jgi:hypothetical protein
VATITADAEDSPVWPKDSRQERAVYVCRLVVSRPPEDKHKGLGAALLNWAGLRAWDQYGAQWIRVDVWTTNNALHDYYRRQGFEFYGFSEELADYPSTALFQKPTGGLRPAAHPLFQLIPRSAG